MTSHMKRAIRGSLSATPLSWRERSAGRLRAFSWLARMSLGVLLSSMMPACLIEDPPPYTEPQQTPPWLDLRQAVPLIDQVIVRNSGDFVAFNVPVRSEDAGDGLVAYLVRNWMGDGLDFTRIEGVAQVGPSTLDDLDRDLLFDWSVGTAEELNGCQRLTLLVTHNANIDAKLVVSDKNDLAMAVWWANINTDAATSGMLQNCPLATERAN